MCGIVAILGDRPAAPRLIEALRRLEYRGYDSAGVATLESGRIARRRAAGKLRNLETLLAQAPLSGTVGVGHTRWATHGRASEANAHPHANARVAVVHNGIIENFRELREALVARGHRFESETDTEVVAHLVADEIASGRAPAEAVAAALPQLRGAFALAFLFAGEEDLLIGARRGSPLAVGWGEAAAAGEIYLGSDALALAPLTSEIAYLEEGDWVVARRGGVDFFDAGNARVERPRLRSQASAFLVDKGEYAHFMAKEIHEQPEVVGRTLAHYLDMGAGCVRLPFDPAFDPMALPRVTLVACGTAYYAAMTAKYWFERFARLAVDVDVASEFRYRDTPFEAGGLTIVVSQSGETADTLASLRHARAAGQIGLAVVNVPTSSIARESDLVAPTLAGPEIGVASTKAFTCQLAALACLAVWLGRARGVLGAADEARLVAALTATPGLMATALQAERAVQAAAPHLAQARDALFIGRGVSYPLALEAALKLKEISYIHAEGYAAGELKHGPIALIDEAMPVVVFAPDDATLEKTISNVQEAAARGGRIVLVGEAAAARQVATPLAAFIEMAPMAPEFTPIVYAAAAQLLAYHAAVLMGRDVDQPRNLAKSVTVE